MLNPLGAGLDVMPCDQHPNFKILILALCCLEIHSSSSYCCWHL